VQKEGEEVLQALEQRFPAACGADHGEAAVPLQPREVHGGADPHLQPGENPAPEQFVEDCVPWEGPHAGAGAE